MGDELNKLWDDYQAAKNFALLQSLPAETLNFTASIALTDRSRLADKLVDAVARNKTASPTDALPDEGFQYFEQLLSEAQSHDAPEQARTRQDATS